MKTRKGCGLQSVFGFLFLFAVAGALLCCGVSSSGTSNGGGTTLPTLVDDDKPSIPPCPHQELLTDATFKQDLKAADAATILFDDTNFPTSVCAVGSSFNPIDANLTEDLVYFGNYNLNVLLDIGIGVCGTDPLVNSLPTAGVYRRDFKLTGNGRSYRIRLRAAITAGTPDVLGQSLASVGINDLETDIQYFDADGGLLPTDATLLSTVIDQLPGKTYVLKKVSDGSTLFTANVEMVCAEQL